MVFPAPATKQPVQVEDALVQVVSVAPRGAAVVFGTPAITKGESVPPPP